MNQLFFNVVELYFCKRKKMDLHCKGNQAKEVNEDEKNGYRLTRLPSRNK
jgi:hypothetical protein